MNFIKILLILNFIEIFAETETSFNSETYIPSKSVRSFQQDHRKFKSDSIQVVDQAFFELYEVINTELVKIPGPSEEFKESFRSICGKLKKSKLEKSTKLKWRAACADVDNSITATLFGHEKALEVFYSGDILDPTPIALILEGVYYKIDQQMGNMWNIYTKNQSCVLPLLETYFPSFHPIIDNIVYFTNLTVKEIPTIFNQTLGKTASADFKATECINWTRSCLKSKKVEYCLEKIVKIFEKDSSQTFTSHFFPFFR